MRAFLFDAILPFYYLFVKQIIPLQISAFIGLTKYTIIISSYPIVLCTKNLNLRKRPILLPIIIGTDESCYEPNSV